MSTVAENNKRIAKNTFFLYIRMFLMMGVSLYTSRVILQTLGVEDFGIYNIVGGIVVLFTFINNAMVASTQRFLNYELGRNDIVEAQKIFSVSLTMHAGISLLFLIVAETIGLWFFYNYIKIPVGREYAAFWVYQFTIFTSIVNILRTPYNAAIIAYERMSFYAYISIFEAFFKLLIVYLIVLFADRLIAYAGLVAIVTFITIVIYYIYCKREFEICSYKFEYEKSRYLSIASFSGWSLWGSAANMGVQQGFNILLNIFFGVGLNAALGIANQVNNAVYTFVSNFQTAFNPQIVKTYAGEDHRQFFGILLNSSRYSYYLLFTLALPIALYSKELLELWLGIVPEYSVVFCRIMIFNSLFDALSGPLWMSVYASGDLKKYQISISFLLLLTIVVAYIVAKLGGNPYIVLAVKPLLNIVIYVYRLVYCGRHLNLNIATYLMSVGGKCLLVSFVCVLFALFFDSLFETTIITLFIKIILSCLFSVICILILGTTQEEKNYCKKIIQNLCARFSHK